MPIPDIGTAGSVAGWFVAVLMMASLVGLIVAGKLVPGATHDVALKTLERQDARLDKQAELLAEQTQHARVLSEFVLSGYRGDGRPAPVEGPDVRHDR